MTDRKHKGYFPFWKKAYRRNKMTEEIKQKYNEWLEENGGTSGVLYNTFSDDELEHIFISAYAKNKR